MLRQIEDSEAMHGPAYDAAINRLSGWVKVKDKLPPKRVEVLVWWGDFDADGESGWCLVARLSPDGVWLDTESSRPVDDVTYWMPLPKPPND